MDIKWEKEYETGVRLIDSQHRNFTTKLDRLVNAVKIGHGQIEVDKMVSFLNGYINSHFELEEKYMKNFKYPEIEFHKTEHRKFKKLFAGIKMEFSQKRVDSKFAHYCQNEIWEYFIKHITVIDADMARFLKSKGAL